MIEDVYPEPASALPGDGVCRGRALCDPSVHHRGRSAVVLAVISRPLSASARRPDGMIELVPQVGDFVVGGRADLCAVRRRRRGQRSHGCGGHAVVAFGPERTLEQDPLFAFRILVDIANKALSAAINDPTTAGAHDRPAASPAAPGRQAASAQRPDNRHLGTTAPDPPDAELGGLRQPRLQRDSCVRRGQPSDRAPHARDAREPPGRCRSTASPRWTLSSTYWIGLSKRISAVPRTRAGPHPRFAGIGGFDEGR